MTATDVFDRFHLYSFADKFIIEPRNKNGILASDSYFEIDRNLGELKLQRANEHPIPLAEGDVMPIYGILGIIRLVSGYHLIVIKRAELVGTINDSEVYHVTETAILPFSKSTLHLTERQKWFQKHFFDMIQLVLATTGFYYSTSHDLTHSLQWLSENATPNFRQLPMMERANPRFVWNRHLAAPMSAIPELARYTLPVMHGFVGIRKCLVRGSSFKLAIISRRSIHRAGVRFYMRGTDLTGNSANFVESEQIVEFDRAQDPLQRTLTSFIQMRGSIPLFWSQKPNLRWQPLPCLRPADDQMDAFVRHMKLQQLNYGGKHVIVNLVNTKGREKGIGGELERVTVQANLDFVRYVGFDFHKECKSLNWDRLQILQSMLDKEIREFGFFYSHPGDPSKNRYQTGYIRSNCMDCLDRTNVVQAMFAKDSLRYQLVYLGIVDASIRSLEEVPDFAHLFKNLWYVPFYLETNILLNPTCTVENNSDSTKKVSVCFEKMNLNPKTVCVEARKHLKSEHDSIHF